MATAFKPGYVPGAKTARSTNPVGDNFAANFVRGFTMYHDKDVAALRNAQIADDKSAFKAHLLANNGKV